jgi:hypothetical protein
MHSTRLEVTAMPSDLERRTSITTLLDAAVPVRLAALDNEIAIVRAWGWPGASAFADEMSTMLTEYRAILAEHSMSGVYQCAACEDDNYPCLARRMVYRVLGITLPRETYLSYVAQAMIDQEADGRMNYETREIMQKIRDGKVVVVDDDY